jgi:hypothetical protein
MTAPTPTHQPRMAMCMGCAHKLQDCSHLDFSKMEPIREYLDGTVQVRCTGFERREEKS